MNENIKQKADSKLTDFDLSELTTKPIGELGGKPLHLDRWGLRPTPQTDIDLLPDLRSVKVCREWFRRYAKPATTINENYNSYQLTGAVTRMVTYEDMNSSWIGTGDVILAAILENYIWIPDSSCRGFPGAAFFVITLPLSLPDRIDSYITEPLLLGPNNEIYQGTPEQRARYSKQMGLR